ncbi:hypoxanthine phosphoribosyltransferase [Bacteroidia bacterium]|nr:hypoxanthine phosphoribosyltransferase [Bacteroidia bacterium]GHT05212.1 hypoxanthine phosphoribosyltransferase [Bacteroidia bacterium]GHT50018.1 hypoxanthine phosphoribosyltransferase [Bacteroidia bacterium]
MTRIQLKDKKFEIFLTEDTILKEIDRVAKQINEDLKDKEPLFICILNGAFMFATELIGRFDSTCNVTFVRLQSYEGVERGVDMKEVQGLVENIENRHVVIIEDIIDTGHTMKHLLNMLEGKNPASIQIATLLLKPNALQVVIKPDYVVQEIPNDFIVGFGLDYDGHGRNLRNIYKVAGEEKC